MKEVKIPFLSSTSYLSSFDQLDKLFDKLSPQKIDHLLWSKDGYKPDVIFKIAHNNACVFLRFAVFENHIAAVHVNVNDPVYLDTCVEFFIGIGNDDEYYNLEFNRLGTCCVGYGAGKKDRQDVAATEIEKIRSRRKMVAADGGFIYGWQLELIIPVTVFAHHPDVSLNNLFCKANFYKCGDNLPQPHFLAWNNIESDQPNFHLPQFFGNLQFLPEA